VPAYQTEQLMLWGDGQSRTGDPNKKKKISGDDLPDLQGAGTARLRNFVSVSGFRIEQVAQAGL
jgi:hypothetical protein